MKYCIDAIIWSRCGKIIGREEMRIEDDVLARSIINGLSSVCEIGYMNLSEDRTTFTFYSNFVNNYL